MKSKAPVVLVSFLIFLLFSYSAVNADTGVISALGVNADTAAAASEANASSGPVNITAPSAILTDAERGQVLYEKNPKERLHISVVCKLMTVLIAVESGKLNSNVTVSTDSLDATGSALNLEAGEKYSLEDLLYGIMLTPANDAAKAVAEFIGGDTDKFVALMNSTANKLNMTNTHFVNPTGLYDEKQYTTAYDLSLLMKYALANDTFNSIFSIKAKPWDYNNSEAKILTNQDKLFWSYNGTDGGKTGFNDKDRQSAVTTATHGDMRLICIVLDSPEADLFTGSTTLFDYGFGKYMKSVLVHAGDILKTVNLDGNDINLVSSSDASYIHPLGDSYIKQFSATSILQAPVKKSNKGGTATYTLNDGTIINIDLYPDKDIVPPENFISTAKDLLLANRNILYLIVFLLMLEFIFMLAYTIRLIKKVCRKISKSGKPKHIN